MGPAFLLSRRRSLTRKRAERSGHFLDAEAAELELAALGLQADAALVLRLEGFFEDLVVALALGLGAGDGDGQLVPVAVLEVLELLVRADGRVVAHLQLRAADVDAAVGPRGGAELQLQD